MKRDRDRTANRCLILIALLSVTVTIGIVCLMAAPAMAQEEQWNKTFGGTGLDTGRSVHQSADSGYIVAGYTESYGAGGYDVWLIKSSTSAPKPDLIAAMITPLSFFPNQPNTITGTLANTGSADASSFNVSLSVDGAVVDTAGVASLCAGSTVDVNFTWTPAVGNHELCVFADCDFAINESNEDNNELCEDVTVHVNTVYLMPISSTAVEVRVNTTDAIDHVLTDISFDPAGINITDVEFGPDFTLADWIHKGDHITIDGFDFGPSCTPWNDRLLANLTVHCKDCCCMSQLSFTGLENVTKLIECGGKAMYGANWIDGSVRCALEDITPPASITNLTSMTGNFRINWTWNNPQEDFNYTMVYLDGTWKTNTSLPFYNATDLDPDTWYEIGTHTVDKVGNVNVTWVNGTARTLPLPMPPKPFDTGKGTYPSIMGTHNGNITPAHSVTVSRMYTYPCAGTGGHSEYVELYNDTFYINATWNGYQGDYHNITFPQQFTLLANHTYNYTIVTGSYPQIIHKQNHTTLDGSLITCKEFIDANDKKYNDWIPAIKLFL